MCEWIWQNTFTTPGLSKRSPRLLPFGKRPRSNVLVRDKREDVVVDGIVVGKVDGRSDGDRDHAGDEVFVALPDFRAHRRDGRLRRVLQVDDDVPQLRFRSKRDGLRRCGSMLMWRAWHVTGMPMETRPRTEAGSWAVGSRVVHHRQSEDGGAEQHVVTTR